MRWFWCPSCWFVVWAFRERVPWHRVRRCTACRQEART